MTGPEIIVLWAIIVGGAVLLSVIWAVAWVTVATAEMDNAIGEVDWDDEPVTVEQWEEWRDEVSGVSDLQRGPSPLYDQDSPADRVYR